MQVNIKIIYCHLCFIDICSKNQDDYLKENILEEFYDVTDKEEQDEYLEEISKGLGYAIVPEYRWKNQLYLKSIRHKIKASGFQDMFDSFNINAKRNPLAENDFANVFSDVNLGDTRFRK